MERLYDPSKERLVCIVSDFHGKVHQDLEDQDVSLVLDIVEHGPDELVHRSCVVHVLDGLVNVPHSAKHEQSDGRVPISCPEECIYEAI